VVIVVVFLVMHVSHSTSNLVTLPISLLHGMSCSLPVVLFLPISLHIMVLSILFLFWTAYNELSMKTADGGRPLFIGAHFVCFLFYSTKTKLSPANALIEVLIDWVL